MLSLAFAAVLAHGPMQPWEGGKPAIPSDVMTERFSYSFEGETFNGYVAWPKDTTPDMKLSGAIVFHQWFGEGEYEQWRAEELAHLGMVAFAADMYGEGKRATNNDEAIGLIIPLRSDPARFHRLLQAIMDSFVGAYPVDSSSMAVSGYCSGGQAVLEIARKGYPGIVAASAFHPSTTNLTAMKEPPSMVENVHIHYPELEGAGDEGLSFFEWEVRYGGIPGWTTFKYGNMRHGFTDPLNGAYNAVGSRLSHEYMYATLVELGLAKYHEPAYDTEGLACDPADAKMCGDHSCKCETTSRALLFASTGSQPVCKCG